MTASIKRTLLVLIAGGLLLGAASAAQADPPDYAPDYRGDDNSVHAIFSRIGPGVPWNVDLFDTVINGYPLSQLPAMTVDDETDTVVQLPNFIDPLPVKHMRLQLTFDGEVDREFLSISILAQDAEAPTDWFVVDSSPPGVANVHYLDIDIYPNPDSEAITIYGAPEVGIFPGNLYQIEIDTVSVPEPASMGLLLAGAAVLLKKRRRR